MFKEDDKLSTVVPSFSFSCLYCFASYIFQLCILGYPLWRLNYFLRVLPLSAPHNFLVPKSTLPNSNMVIVFLPYLYESLNDSPLSIVYPFSLLLNLG